MAEWMVGVDTGGTFTDLVAFEPSSGKLHTIKVPSVPADPSRAVIHALDELFREDYRRATSDFWCTAPRWPPTRFWRAPGCVPGF